MIFSVLREYNYTNNYNHDPYHNVIRKPSQSILLHRQYENTPTLNINAE